MEQFHTYLIYGKFGRLAGGISVTLDLVYKKHFAYP